MHPRVALHLGQWLSTEFAVAVTGWVVEHFASGRHFSHRYQLNRGNVPFGYFSALSETHQLFFEPMAEMGWIMPEYYTSHDGEQRRNTPDISVGMAYTKHLREQGVDVDAFPKYPQQYTDGRGIRPSNAYPNEYLPEFRRWFVEDYLPRLRRYLDGRAPDALPFFDGLVKLPAYNPPKALTGPDSRLEQSDDK